MLAKHLEGRFYFFYNSLHYEIWLLDIYLPYGSKYSSIKLYKFFQIFVMCPQKLILKTTWVYSDMGLHVPSKFFFNMQPNDPAPHEQHTMALLRFCIQCTRILVVTRAATIWKLLL